MQYGDEGINGETEDSDPRVEVEKDPNVQCAAEWVRGIAFFFPVFISAPRQDAHATVAFGALERGTKGQAIPASVIQTIEIVCSADGSPFGSVISAEPFKFTIPKDNQAKFRIHFMGHYREPYLDLKV